MSGFDFNRLKEFSKQIFNFIVNANDKDIDELENISKKLQNNVTYTGIHIDTGISQTESAKDAYEKDKLMEVNNLENGK